MRPLCCLPKAKSRTNNNRTKRGIRNEKIGWLQSGIVEALKENEATARGVTRSTNLALSKKIQKS